ncbi:MAG: hypothetical protein PHF05_00055 [Candidatus Izemoplasmatales bacterium]|nr:hypothetical protein [Candidatus Izemoplasmatales bacterium]
MNPNPRLLARATCKQTRLLCMYLTDYIKREHVITKRTLEMLMDFSGVASYRVKLKRRDEDTSTFIKRTEPETVEIIITKREAKFLNEISAEDEVLFMIDRIKYHRRGGEDR